MRIRQVLQKILVVIIVFLFPQKLFSQAGHLDTTFGQGGIVTTRINDSSQTSESYSTAIQSDGKIISAGYSSNGSDNDFAIIRYNLNGSLDNTFGINGIAITQIGLSDDYAYSVAIQEDGKIVAAGSSKNGTNSDFAIVRYNQSGDLDDTFGINGIVTTPVGTISAQVNSILIQADNKILAIGSSYSGSDFDFTIARYNSNGTLDNTFGINGISTTTIGNLTLDEATSGAIQRDGKIVVAGYSTSTPSTGGNYVFAVVRYNQNGALDNTFGTNGILTKSIGKSVALATSVVIQSDSNIVVAGYSNNGEVSNYDFTLVRYTKNGELDSSFGTNGITALPTGKLFEYAYSVALQNDGKIIAAGTALNINTDFALVRYTSNGDLDNTFGTNGIVTTQIRTSNDAARSMAIQNDGKIVVSGYSSNGTNNDFAIIRYNLNGALDNTFGINGISITQMGPSQDEARSAAIQSDGKIIAAGYSNFYFALARYKPNGDLDDTFGTNGIVTTPVGESADIAGSVAIQTDGKIIAAGSSYNSVTDYDFAVVRYKSNGFLDNTFGTNGIVTTAVVNSEDYAASITLQNDNKIVAAGSSFNGNDHDFALVRYNINGTLDNTFGPNGIVITDIKNSDDLATSIAIQNDNKIVAAGYSFNGNDYDFAVVRYNPNGTLDSTFGTKGIVTTSISNADDYASSLAIQIDNKIIVAGSSFNEKDFAMIRYNPNGTLDNTFGKNGIVNIQSDSSYNVISSVAIQSDGKIVAAGSSGNNSTILRYNSDGTLDNNFGVNGIEITPIGNSKNTTKAMLLQSDGKIITAGSAFKGNYRVFSLIRYNGDPVTGLNEKSGDKIPTSFKLEQNYPNPFNPTTKIKYSIPDVGNADLRSLQTTLKVYDILGKEVTTLVNQQQQPGNYEAEFNAGSLASGIYFYKMQAGSFFQTKKMLLLK